MGPAQASKRFIWADRTEDQAVERYKNYAQFRKELELDGLRLGECQNKWTDPATFGQDIGLLLAPPQPSTRGYQSHASGPSGAIGPSGRVVPAQTASGPASIAPTQTQYVRAWQTIKDPEIIKKIGKYRAEMEAQFRHKSNKSATEGRAGAMMLLYSLSVRSSAMYHFLLVTTDDMNALQRSGNPTGNHEVIAWRMASANMKHTMDVASIFSV